MGQSTDGFTFCYPYGDYDQDTVTILEDLGCSAAVTTKVALAEVGSSALLELPRINTNDLPVTGPTKPNEWTRTAAG